MKEKINISITFVRIMNEYNFVVDICADIKRKYGINNRMVEINKVKRLIQEVFKIRAPRLSIKDIHEFGAGSCVEIREGKVVGVYIEKELVESGDIVEIYHSIAHEMRHIWQYKNGYSMTRQVEDFREYALSESEVDSEAFASLFMALFFKRDCFLYEEEIIAFAEEMTCAVANRVKRIEVDVIWKIVSFWKKNFFFSREIGEEMRVSELDTLSDNRIVGK